jgi:hypothetical protein
MTLRDRAALALDMTHSSTKGIRYVEVRDYVAAWLDGRTIKTSLIRKSIAYLEMVSRG